MFTLRSRSLTYKNPVLTPHLAAPLIINGVQKLNMIAIRFDAASAQPAVFARKRCCGTSAAYAYPIALAPVVEKVARQAKKT